MDLDRITSETPISEIVQLLSEAGCPDITEQLDLSRCSQWRIPEGGQGDIYRGVLVDERHVAIKTTRGDQSINLSKGNVSFKRAARELHTWFTLSHPNIAEFLGMATFRGHIAMVSPWISPGNFYRFIEKYPEADRMFLCIQIANGLAYLHENGVVCGDLKAQNILIGVDGIPKMTDFGLSVLESSKVVFSTTTNFGGGTARWMAPELIKGSTGRSCEADLYALGMTFIEVFTGEIPFPSIRDDAQVIYRVVFDHVTPDQPERLNVRALQHEIWWFTLNECWDRDPSKRPKASAWSEIDVNIQAVHHRCQKLADLLDRAMLNGCTEEGPLKNLDTNESIDSADDQIVFSISSGTQSSLQTLASLFASKIGTRQHIPEAEYIEDLQDQIDNCLSERAEHVKYWIDVNVAHLPHEYHTTRDLDEKFGCLESALWLSTQICAAKCSTCDLNCLQFFNQFHAQHDCGTDHMCIFNCALEEKHQKPRLCGNSAGHKGLHICPEAHPCHYPVSSDLQTIRSRCLRPVDHLDDHVGEHAYFYLNHFSMCSHCCDHPGCRQICSWTEPLHLHHRCNDCVLHEEEMSKLQRDQDALRMTVRGLQADAPRMCDADEEMWFRRLSELHAGERLILKELARSCDCHSNA